MRRSWKSRLGAACLAAAMCLALPMSSRAEEPEGVDVARTFTDTAFRNYVSTVVDTDGNGNLSDSEINAVEKMTLFGKGIQSLAGVGVFKNLRELDCGSNDLTELNLKGNPGLLFLKCDANQLTTLDLSGNTKIVRIICKNNQLKKLILPEKAQAGYEAGEPGIDTTGNPDLRVIDMRKCDLRAGGYGVESFDDTTVVVRSDEELGFQSIGGKRVYIRVSLTDPDVIESVISDWVSLDEGRYYFDENGFAVTGTQIINNKEYFFNQDGLLQDGIDWTQNPVKIEEETFPDETFRAYVYTNYDENKDGVLSVAERADVVEMDVQCKSITTMEGVEYFTNLNKLNCQVNQLTSLDISALTNLDTLICENNQLDSLVTGTNEDLVYLNCYGNQIKSLVLSENTNLRTLYCGSNGLTELNLGDNRKLKSLDCSGNQLTALDVSKNADLENLDCDYNQISDLTIVGAASLKELMCYHNNLKSLDVSSLKNLLCLNCCYNQITSLTVNGASQLEGVNCYGNPLTSINISGCPNLLKAYKKGNQDEWIDEKGDGAEAKLFELMFPIPREGGYSDIGWYYIGIPSKARIIDFVAGWGEVSGKKVYYLEDGTLAKGLKKIGKKTYYFDQKTGYMQYGWVTIGKNKYFFNLNSGEMYVGWCQIEGYYFYFENGIMQTGLKKIGSATYYLRDGMRQVGMWQIGSKYYYLDPLNDGKMKTGWLDLGKKYYFGKDGVRLKGWQNIGKNKYYFSAKNGAALTGWQNIGNKRYYFSPTTCAMKTGWLNLGGKKYYLKNGVMKKGWQLIGKYTYYFKSNGVMAKNEYVKGYFINKKGYKVTKTKYAWKKSKKGRYYINTKKVRLKNKTVTIDGKKYTFDKKGFVKK